MNPLSGCLSWRDYDPAPSDHRAPLDGVRGIAILTVFLYDCLKYPAGGILAFGLRKASTAGWVGVDLFFVLSGFLITGILLDSRGKTGYLSSFLARRACRIFPLYFLSLWLAFMVLPLLVTGSHQHQALASALNVISQEQFWYWTYLQNWRFAVQGHWPEVNFLNHFWSLAVEEQFYLIWPFIVGWTSSRTLARICWSCVVIALGLRVGLWIADAPKIVLYVSTLTRMDSLCLGALFALGMRSPVWYPRLTRWVVPAMATLALLIVGIDAAWPLLKTEQVGSQTIGHSCLGVLFGGLVFYAASVAPGHWSARLLSTRCLTIPGQFSYAMYVIHRPIYKAVSSGDWSSLPNSVQPLAIFVATLIATLVASVVSWRVIERPFLGLKEFFPRPQEPTLHTKTVPPSVPANAVSA